MSYPVTVNRQLVASIVRALVASTSGPGEAFATLCAAIIAINDIAAEDTSIDFPREKLAEEAKLVILSFRKVSHVEH